MRSLALLSFLLCAGCSQPSKQPALAKAAEYLWGQQAGDGGWPSHTYGLLRSGQSLTPFVVEALLQVPSEVYRTPSEKLERALKFIRQNTNSDGALGMQDPSLPDYPNYATALAVSAICKARRPDWQNQAAPMVAYLRSQQFSEQNGWKPADAPYGAWGMGGIDHPPPNPGHVDLSMTRYVLEALRDSGIPAGDAVFSRARIFVERCQNFGNADGGFFFSTTETETNKAGRDGDHFRSYGTTTADGILSLLAIGRPRNDERVAAAERWLTAQHKDMDVPGFAGDAHQRWPKGLAFYYAAESTLAFKALGVPRSAKVAQTLERSQQPDGSWKNAENLVKEDDPYIATGFAIRALVNR